MLHSGIANAANLKYKIALGIFRIDQSVSITRMTSDGILQETINSMRNQIEALKAKVTSLEGPQELQILSNSSRPLVYEHIVTEFESKIEPEPEVDPQHDALNEKHTAILEEWRSHSVKLQAWSECEGKAGILGKPDPGSGNDEKEAAPSITGTELFSKFTECQRIINEQRTRLDVVSTDKHLLELIDQQTRLSELVQQRDSDLRTGTEPMAQKRLQYSTVGDQRAALMESIKADVARCNELIKTENKLCQEIQQHAAQNKCAVLKLNRMKGSLVTCSELVDAYNEFMRQNLKFIAIVGKSFEALWIDFEATWRSWSVSDVAIWFQFKAGEQLRDKVDWAAVTEKLVEQEITGVALQEVNALTFKFIGLKNAKVVALLVSAIETLKQSYRATSNEVESKPNIPEEFVCPITKKLMLDPVLAFDGRCYDRAAIEEYLKLHNKSPITGDEAVTTMVFPNHGLKSKIIAFIEADEAGPCVEEEEPKEGDGETALM